MTMLCGKSTSFKIDIVKASGSHSATAQCKSGRTLLGGGCRNLDSANKRLRTARPSGDNAWQCGSDGATNRAYAVCSAQVFPCLSVM